MNVRGAVVGLLLCALVAAVGAVRLTDRAEVKAPAGARVYSAIRFALLETASVGDPRLRRTLVAESGPDGTTDDLDAILLDRLTSRGWSVAATDCGGDPPCRPPSPTARVLVDEDDVYLRVCTIGRHDGEMYAAAAPARGVDTRNIGCAEAIATSRAHGGQDGQVLLVMEFPRFGAGRWLN